MKKSLLLLLLFICVSCSYTIIEKKDVIKTQNGVFIQAYYSEKSCINNTSSYCFVVKNSSNIPMYIFSTVLENPIMFYSKKNHSIKKNEIIFYSHYYNYMEDVIHSGIKKYNFIKVLPNDNLRINIDESFVNQSKKKKMKLIYYYFYGDINGNLLNTCELSLQKGVQTVEI